MLSIGKQLLQAREGRKLSLKDVEFKTHIPVNHLRDMENDDLSNFGNLIYAKSFLKLYSNYLDLDIAEYLEQFDTRALSDVTGHEYAQHAGFTRSFAAPSIAPSPSRAPLVLLLGAIFAVIGGIIWFAKSRPDPAPAPASPPAVPETMAEPAPESIPPEVPPASALGSEEETARPDTPEAGPPPRAEPIEEEPADADPETVRTALPAPDVP